MTDFTTLETQTTQLLISKRNPGLISLRVDYRPASTNRFVQRSHHTDSEKVRLVRGKCLIVDFNNLTQVVSDLQARLYIDEIERQTLDLYPNR